MTASDSESDQVQGEAADDAEGSKVKSADAYQTPVVRVYQSVPGGGQIAHHQLRSDSEFLGIKKRKKEKKETTTKISFITLDSKFHHQTQALKYISAE